MDIYKYGSDYEFKNPVFILGSFESLHIGHYELILAAKKFGKQTVMMIFDDPDVMPNKSKEKFIQLEVRLQQIADLGIDNVILVEFSKVKHLPGQVFLDMLFKKQKPVIVCGADFKFGSDLLDVNYLKKYYETVVCDLQLVKGHKISTSIIKEQIPMGFVEFANKLLVKDYAIKIRLESGFSFKWSDILKLHYGIYAATIEINDFMYYCVLHVDMNQNQHLKFLDFDAKEEAIINADYILNIHQEIRLISNQRLDKISSVDLQNAKAYFVAKIKENNA
ncbi:riboflavin kinase [Mycoplasmopsis californica]|uniref:FAD synthase n=1 Tax=Mycoplasmopsis equigenitalium TaxID=114883 RepID=A0ABY5J203_9BACT|nr:hypothetical protein [Mycoplasmopsis equigenitalium]UUD37273.1 hypothetical protein NPA09_01735 [Mycoplasmopsis equigenitalium]VEU69418.1 riboflavin kinase [Mycoplasmopsis californica]